MTASYPSSVELVARAGRAVLFLDLLEVDDMRRVRQVVRPAAKHPANPVIRTGPLGAWDSLQACPWQGTVMWDAEDGYYKAWYMGMDVAEAGLQIPRVGYAVSPDGSTWEKPNVGAHEYGGSRENNLVAFLPGRRTNGPALKDPGETEASRRYKLLLRDENSDREIWNSPMGCTSRARALRASRRRRPPMDRGGISRIPSPGSTRTSFSMTGKTRTLTGGTRPMAKCRNAAATWGSEKAPSCMARIPGRGPIHNTTQLSTPTTARSLRFTSSRFCPTRVCT